MTTLNVQRVSDNHVNAYCVQSCISCHQWDPEGN